ncbi:MAG: HipA domain-containing protein [Methylococcaceae bacterium]
MGRKGHWINQPVDEPVNISNWKGDEEFEVYPEGARDKTLLYSPAPAPHEFLISNHRYLYKHAFSRHPDQYWTEIIAYHVGCLLNVPVPPAFVAHDEDNHSCGALIEWFLNYRDQPEERFVPGGDIMVSAISGYDRKKGQQHNFAVVERYLSTLAKSKNVEMSEWMPFWCDMLLFDALIGNTDRHQDNWGLLWGVGLENRISVRMAPVFDNGTSLGYEILERNMDGFLNPSRMQSYINKGRHHIRYELHSKEPAQHIELLELLASKNPEIAHRIKYKLDSFNIDRLRSIIEFCTKFKIPIPLTEKRAEFVCHLIESRYLAISKRIEKRL